MTLTPAWAEEVFEGRANAVVVRDWESFESFHHPDVTYVSPIAQCVGRVAVRRRYEDVAAAVPDLSITATTMMSSLIQNRAVYESTYRGTLAGSLTTSLGIVLPDGPFALRSALVLCFDNDGLITEARTYFGPDEENR